MTKYYAHSGDNYGRWHRLANHLSSVATRAAEFATAFGAENEARLAGILHDLGKYGDIFQQRLNNPAIKGVDHWTAGAWSAVEKYHKAGPALAVAGHHLGLPSADGNTMNGWNPNTYHSPKGTRLSESDLDLLINRLEQDGINLPSIEEVSGGISDGLFLEATPEAAAMLDMRMLFSCLVDADFLDTEAHFQRGPDGRKKYRPMGPELRPDWALDTLLDHLKELGAKSTADESVNSIRQELLQSCLDKASLAPGLFTLTAPTGAGKTLAMLAFALKHAQKHNLRRVVVVIPYLSVIEQTARVYQAIFKPRLPDGQPVEHYILEHHSMANPQDTSRDGEDSQNPAHRTARLLSQNWDAPIIITTSVQILESLFANRPAKCRKLHRLSQSVILFDEVQTLPNHLAVPTLACLARLSSRFNTSVVFSTATQPAFSSLGPRLKEFARAKWEPTEIVGQTREMFQKAKRVRVHWPKPEERLTWPEVAQAMIQEPQGQVLCVVNLKRHAKALLEQLRELGVENLFHLSTNMCPSHRTEVLKQVRARLQDPEKPPIYMVSTQCIEAGVDLDMPVVYRAWGPLTSIAQAAGRCNRNGNLNLGKVVVFRPKEEDKRNRLYPDSAYTQAAGVTDMLLADYGSSKWDIDDPEIYRAYYKQLYSLANTGGESDAALTTATKERDFPEVARCYRLIENDAVNVLVPYDKQAFEELADLARQDGLSREWINRAKPHSVSIFRPTARGPLPDFLEPIPLVGKASGVMSDDWFICRAAEAYDPLQGLDVNHAGGLQIV